MTVRGRSGVPTRPRKKSERGVLQFELVNEADEGNRSAAEQETERFTTEVRAPQLRRSATIRCPRGFGACCAATANL